MDRRSNRSIEFSGRPADREVVFAPGAGWGPIGLDDVDGAAGGWDAGWISRLASVAIRVSVWPPVADDGHAVRRCSAGDSVRTGAAATAEPRRFVSGRRG